MLKEGYEVVKSKNIVLSRLSRGNYFIANFSGGKGFCAKRGGGLFGYIDPDTFREMVSEELITESGTILSKGFVELGKWHSNRTK